MRGFGLLYDFGRFRGPARFVAQAEEDGEEQAKRGQEFVDGDLHEQVEIPGLAAALHALLDEPVAERADQPGEEARAVGEDGGV